MQARERALEDPDVQAILRDPGMRLLLEQMSQVSPISSEEFHHVIIGFKSDHNGAFAPAVRVSLMSLRVPHTPGSFFLV